MHSYSQYHHWVLEAQVHLSEKLKIWEEEINKKIGYFKVDPEVTFQGKKQVGGGRWLQTSQKNLGAKAQLDEQQTTVWKVTPTPGLETNFSAC